MNPEEKGKLSWPSSGTAVETLQGFHHQLSNGLMLCYMQESDEGSAPNQLMGGSRFPFPVGRAACDPVQAHSSGNVLG